MDCIHTSAPYPLLPEPFAPKATTIDRVGSARGSGSCTAAVPAAASEDPSGASGASAGATAASSSAPAVSATAAPVREELRDPRRQSPSTLTPLLHFEDIVGNMANGGRFVPLSHGQWTLQREVVLPFAIRELSYEQTSVMDNDGFQALAPIRHSKHPPNPQTSVRHVGSYAIHNNHLARFFLVNC